MAASFQLVRTVIEHDRVDEMRWPAPLKDWHHLILATPRTGGTATEPRSKVTCGMEDIGQGVVKLTVTHDGFPPGSRVLQAISEGWPAVLSSLKTLLETGTALPVT